MQYEKTYENSRSPSLNSCVQHVPVLSARLPWPCYNLKKCEHKKTFRRADSAISVMITESLNHPLPCGMPGFLLRLIKSHHPEP